MTIGLYDIYQREIHGVRPKSEEYERAFKLWLAYYVNTESHDRQVCHARREDGTAIPLSADEQALCSRNAVAELARVKEGTQGIDALTSLQARRDASELSYEQGLIELSRKK